MHPSAPNIHLPHVHTGRATLLCLTRNCNLSRQADLSTMYWACYLRRQHCAASRTHSLTHWVCDLLITNSSTPEPPQPSPTLPWLHTSADTQPSHPTPTALHPLDAEQASKQASTTQAAGGWPRLTCNLTGCARVSKVAVARPIASNGTQASI